ncbi:MAG: ribonuclease Y [Dehalococcoidia bacterium]
MLAGVIIGLVIGVLVAGVALAVYFRSKPSAKDHAAAAQAEAQQILTEAETKHKVLLLEAKEEAIRLKAQADTEIKERRTEVTRQERRIAQRDENLDRKSEAFERRERALQEREGDLDQQRSQVEDLRQQRLKEIERIAELNSQEARSILLGEMEREVREDANRRLRQVEAEVKADADVRARKIIATAIQRVTTDVTSETTVSVVPIPSEDMKGRIIGREGRNIRALEHATGCDLIIDDTPDAVTLSGFDPVRREVARTALVRLIQDGRIHPTRIEEIVEKARREVETTIREAGETAAIEAACPGLHPDLLRVFGRLKFRTSYGQNQLRHAVETSRIGAMIAHEIGANVEIARRGSLLHDLGKAVDHEVEGTHAMIGADIAKRYGLPPAVVHCIAAHHEEIEPQTVESLIVIIADSISGGRPGARRESLEHYIKRLEALESIANGFPGVERSFAIQAGREVRIIVRPNELDDVGSMRLARDVAKKIEESLQYPGQVKVTVVRETRATEFAK